MNLILTQTLGNKELFLLISKNNHRFVIPLIFFCFFIVNKNGYFQVQDLYVISLTANYAEFPMPYNKRRPSVLKTLGSSRSWKAFSLKGQRVNVLGIQTTCSLSYLFFLLTFLDLHPIFLLFYFSAPCPFSSSL